MAACKATLNCGWKFKAGDSSYFLKKKGHSAFWQPSTDSMLLLLSLSSTEKQEAQNQFGLEVGMGESWWKGSCFCGWGLIHIKPQETTLRSPWVSCWAALFEHFWTHKEILLHMLGFWLSFQDMAFFSQCQLEYTMQ